MKAKKNFILFTYVLFLHGMLLCLSSVKLLGWNYSVTKMLSFLIACFLLCFAINVLRQNTACWKRKMLVALAFLTGFVIMALVMRFFDTNVQECMLGVLVTISLFWFFANGITEVIEK